jgi:hypothetical protein
MSCCGQRRGILQGKMSGKSSEHRETTQTGPPAGSVLFEYVGSTAMTLVGPSTGRRYRFGWPGAQVAVDLKDAARVAASVPHLRMIRNPDF